MIIGITANKSHGKDRFANEVLALAADRGWSGYINTKSFADRLKKGCVNVLGLPRPMFYDTHLKETPFDKPIALDDYLDRFSVEFELVLEKQGKFAKSPRQVLQYIGTEYVRSAQDDYWLVCLLRSLTSCDECRRNVPHECSTKLRGRASTPGIHLIPDCRYLNEASAIRSVGGKIVRIVREGMPAPDLHQSEMEMSKIVADTTIYTLHYLEGPNTAALELFRDPYGFFKRSEYDLRV